MSYESSIIVPGSLRAAGDGTYTLDLRLAYYRALGLSMVEGIDVLIDGRPTDPGDSQLVTPTGAYRFAQLVDLGEERWPFTEARTLRFAGPDTLATGEHEITVSEHLRISYIGTGIVATDRKRLTVGA